MTVVVPSTNVSAASVNTPPGQVLVVTANVEEAFDSADVADPSDLVLFARELISSTPYLPDVLALQEVSHKSIATVADILSAETGQTYVIAARPPDPLFKVIPGGAINADTGILLNSSTTRATSRGSYLTHKYLRGDKAPDMPISYKRTAIVSFAKKDGSVRGVATSAHWTNAKWLKSREVSQKYRLRWTNQLQRYLRLNFPRIKMRLPTGDLNTTRGTRTSSGFLTYPWWTKMTERFGYKDAVHAITRKDGVDHIFGRRIVDAGVDLGTVP